jgi:hypothetical protein
MEETGYGYWGFSPASNPRGGYSVYGVDAIGMDPAGYPSDLEGTNFDREFEGCRERTNPNPTFGDGVVTPHAAFLAMQYAPWQAIENLSRIETNLRTALVASTTPSRSGRDSSPGAICRWTRRW